MKDPIEQEVFQLRDWKRRLLVAYRHWKEESKKGNWGEAMEENEERFELMENVLREELNS